MAAPLKLPVVKKPADDGSLIVREPLPSIPFQLFILGNCGSGKTNCVTGLALHSDFYRGKFTNIVLFSPSADSDPSLAPFHKCRCATIYTQYSEEVLAEVLANMKEGVDAAKKEGVAPPETLIIWDDMLGEFSSKSKNVLRLATKFRHYHASVIYTTQVFRGLPNSIRELLTAAIIYKVFNQREKMKVLEEFSGFGGGKLEQYLVEATRDRYSFLYLRKSPLSCWLRFEKQLWSLDDEYRAPPSSKEAASGAEGDGGARR